MQQSLWHSNQLMVGLTLWAFCVPPAPSCRAVAAAAQRQPQQGLALPNMPITAQLQRVIAARPAG